MRGRLAEGAGRVGGGCSGHGGSWGGTKKNVETAIKGGRPAARQAAQAGKAYIASECPLAGQHLLQGIDRLQMENKPQVARSYHPIELFAKAYGLADSPCMNGLAVARVRPQILGGDQRPEHGTADETTHHPTRHQPTRDPQLAAPHAAPDLQHAAGAP